MYFVIVLLVFLVIFRLYKNNPYLKTQITNKLFNKKKAIIIRRKDYDKALW